MSFEKPESLTSEMGVFKLMKSSTSLQEWNDNIDKVRAANGDEYPSFWHKVIVEPGIDVMMEKSWRK